ncbi:hypothetical protein [Gilvibacter sp.]|uniref:hypothetical protein n=1 Tax=Gilvibacter sp. TaxID=2729997 RepID=UPI003B5284FC
MRIAVLVLLFCCSCTAVKETLVVKSTIVYEGKKSLFRHKLTLKENGEYLYNYSADWHRYYSYGKWQLDDGYLILIPERVTGEELVTELLSQGGYWFDIPNTEFKVKGEKLIPKMNSWAKLSIE